MSAEDYPKSQEEAVTAEGWRFHTGYICPVACDLVYYRRRGSPDQVLGPTAPEMLRWRPIAIPTDDTNSDILAFLPVLSASQRAHRLTPTLKRAPKAEGLVERLTELLAKAKLHLPLHACGDQIVEKGGFEDSVAEAFADDAVTWRARTDLIAEVVNALPALLAALPSTREKALEEAAKVTEDQIGDCHRCRGKVPRAIRALLARTGKDQS